MRSPIVQQQYKRGIVGMRLILSLCAVLTGVASGALAQSAGFSPGTTFSIRATHLMGFANTKNNCNGSLSVNSDTLRFERDSKRVVEVKIASVEGVFLGSESKQVGGTPVKLGKAAAPFGSGRVFSLFAHKKYDTLTLEYVDDSGGIHGAIFQLNKGQAEQLRREIVTRSVFLQLQDDQTAESSTAEVSNENK